MYITRIYVTCFVPIVCYLLLSACSFKGAYDDPQIRQHLSCVNIVGGEDSHFVVELTQHLSSILPPERCMGTEYNLSANIKYSEKPLIISKESDIVRQQLTANVEYSLINVADHEVVSTQTLIVMDSYNAFDMPYAAYAEERMLKNNLALQGAERIYHQLVLYFASLQAE